MLGIDDIIAAVLLSLIMLRRLETLAYRQEDNSHVAPDDFNRWRRAALRAHNVGAWACFGKVLASQGWLWLVHRPGPLLAVGGLSITVAWVAVLVWAWRQTTEATVLRQELGIRPRGKA